MSTGPVQPNNDANRVKFFDTTLRDGEQSPGITLNTREKLEIAHQLRRLGVDVMEAGFPASAVAPFACARFKMLLSNGLAKKSGNSVKISKRMREQLAISDDQTDVGAMPPGA